MVPNVELAAEAGLAIENGIRVDDDGHVVAAGLVSRRLDRQFEAGAQAQPGREEFGDFRLTEGPGQRVQGGDGVLKAR